MGQFSKIEDLLNATSGMQEDAQNLTKALKGDTKQQGDWGEQILKKALEDAGLVEGLEYELQPSYKGKDGDQLRPDAVIKLSDGRNIIIDSKSGYSGAGRGVHKKYKDKNLYHSLSAYGVGFHRHNSEIDQMLRKFTKKKFQFSFTPHLSPMFRGILSTIYVDLGNNISQTKVLKTLISFYKNESFVKILKSGTLLSTNDVINTNYCYISVCKSKYSNKIIVLSAIDNLSLIHI